MTVEAAAQKTAAPVSRGIRPERTLSTEGKLSRRRRRSSAVVWRGAMGALPERSLIRRGSGRMRGPSGRTGVTSTSTGSPRAAGSSGIAAGEAGGGGSGRGAGPAATGETDGGSGSGGAVMLWRQPGQGPVTPAKAEGTVSRRLQWGQPKERVSGEGIEESAASGSGRYRNGKER